MKSLKIEISNPKYMLKLIKNYPTLCSGRKNYKDFDNRIIKNILLTMLRTKEKNLEKFNKLKPSFIFNKKVAKIIYK